MGCGTSGPAVPAPVLVVADRVFAQAVDESVEVSRSTRLSSLCPLQDLSQSSSAFYYLANAQVLGSKFQASFAVAGYTGADGHLRMAIALSNSEFGTAIEVRSISSGSVELLATLVGHTHPVNRLKTFTRPTDRRTLIVSSSFSDMTIRVWDGETFEALRVLNNGSKVSEILTYDAAAHGSPRIVSGDTEGQVSIWNAISGELLHNFKAENGFVTSIVLLHTDDCRPCLAIGSFTGVDVWDPELAVRITSTDYFGFEGMAAFQSSSGQATLALANDSSAGPKCLIWSPFHDTEKVELVEPNSSDRKRPWPVKAKEVATFQRPADAHSACAIFIRAFDLLVVDETGKHLQVYSGAHLADQLREWPGHEGRLLAYQTTAGPWRVAAIGKECLMLLDPAAKPSGVNKGALAKGKFTGLYSFEGAGRTTLVASEASGMLHVFDVGMVPPSRPAEPSSL
jgi:WD40 repeat protein